MFALCTKRKNEVIAFDAVMLRARFLLYYKKCHALGILSRTPTPWFFMKLIYKVKPEHKN